MRRDLAFDSAFGNEETRADECFVTGPFIARGVTVFANRGQQGVTCEFRTVLSGWLELGNVCFQSRQIVPNNGGLRSRNIQNTLRQHRQRRHEHTTTRRLKPGLRNRVILINLNRKPHVRTADQRCRTTNKTRLVRISYVSRVEEMIRGDFGQNWHRLLKLLAPLPFVKNSRNQLRFSVHNPRITSTI